MIETLTEVQLQMNTIKLTNLEIRLMKSNATNQLRNSRQEKKNHKKRTLTIFVVRETIL